MSIVRKLTLIAVALGLSGAYLLAGTPAQAAAAQKCDTAAVFLCGCINSGAAGTCCWDPNDNRQLIYCSSNGQTPCVVGAVLIWPANGSTHPGTCANPGANIGGCAGAGFNSC